MAELPSPQDPTLETIDKALEQRAREETHRPYLGMSAAGHACRRSLWYGFRWASPPGFDAKTLKRFEDGHAGEALMAHRLRMLPDIELHTMDQNTREQYEFRDHGGHSKGHMDGGILGIYKAPNTWHVWEHKQCDEKEVRALQALIDKHGEKEALCAWNLTYYVQAQLYMHHSGMSRHYLTVSTPGGRHTISCRTEYKKKVAEKAADRMEEIINAPRPLEKVSDKPDYWICEHFCSHGAICHGNKVAEINCRTCCHATPLTEEDMHDDQGPWHCALRDRLLSEDEQREGCRHHVIIPELLPYAQALEGNQDENWMEYQLPDGRKFKNGSGHYISKELAAINPALIGNEHVEQIREAFDAEITK